MTKPAPAPQLAKWTKELNIAEYMKKKDNRKNVRAAAHTSRRALQKKREVVQAKSNQINLLVNLVLEASGNPPKVDHLEPEEAREKLLEWQKGITDKVNMASLIGVSGYLDSQGMVFDALTQQEPCEVIDSATGETKPGHRRRSTNEALWEIEDWMRGMYNLMLIQTRMVNEFIFEKGNLDGWRDENGKSFNPYFRDIEQEAADDDEGPREPPKPETVKVEDAEEAGVSVGPEVPEHDVDMNKVKDFVDGKNND